MLLHCFVVLSNQPQEQQTITFPLDDTSLQNAKALKCLFGPGEAQVQDTTLHVNAPAQSGTVCVVN